MACCIVYAGSSMSPAACLIDRTGSSRAVPRYTRTKMYSCKENLASQKSTATIVCCVVGGVQKCDVRVCACVRGSGFYIGVGVTCTRSPGIAFPQIVEAPCHSVRSKYNENNIMSFTSRFDRTSVQNERSASERSERTLILE